MHYTMENRIEKALAKEKALSAEIMVREIPTLKIEIRELTNQMHDLWNKICEREGIDPGDMDKNERLIVSDENEKLAETYQVVSRMLVVKVHKYKKFCKALNIEPVFETRKPTPTKIKPALITGSAHKMLVDASRRLKGKRQKRKTYVKSNKA